MSTPRPAAEALADWALGVALQDIPSDVRAAACRHLLDGLGVGIAAARRGAAAAAVAVATHEGEGPATVIGRGDRAPSPMAALANGALVHALDYDDTHAEALVHATAAVLPAALAVGEETGASGAEMLVACVTGYETVTRLGAAVRHGFHARGFHATSVCGVFSSALVASRLMGLGVRETVNALGVAGSLASGSLEFLSTGSSTKQLHPGLAGMSGILAARLAAAGAEGPATILEGEYGLYRSFAGAGVDPGELVSGLGERWETRRITIKPYPACQLVHASLDALRAVAAIGDPGGIEQIVFAVPRDSVPIVCEPAGIKGRPRTPYEAKFSLPFAAAALLLDGAMDLDSFERTDRPDVLGLAARVVYRESDFPGPPAEAPGEVEVRLRDGRVLRGSVAGSRGGPDRPLSDDEVLEKFRSNHGGPDAGRLAAMVGGLSDLPDVRALGSASASAVAIP